ncbi:Maltodextrin phosphorylase [Rosistilla oblonga]|uniref:Alpha-1,4 glucan phosphorylase n=2 Tax=Rosistilla TaxID=2795779 RepID=A0A518IPK3_9BACT|nr:MULTISPECIES: glycogen/starch/alpha-glucan phosphorylase [Rosistilla]QDS86791.1 Maltodextrin phosphorylase [Rosistilla ulvae]QDV11106.1 Maltodextrin phosphorylase [Rosistilla oblonga]QDV55026.1 Maltodextrin phosphorylase [Rosistilla oblonga]
MTATTLTKPASIDLAGLDEEIRRHLHYTLGYHERDVSPRYVCRATALAVRDRLVGSWQQTRDAIRETDQRRVYYLSLEFLIGRSLSNAIQNIDLDGPAREALHQYGLSLEEVAEKEHDAGLGNGGLGRLAACFLDSCANLKLPVVGYGIRYEYGMFHQHIENGRQIEDPDHWLRDGNPWEMERPDEAQNVHFYGYTEHYRDDEGTPRCRWAGSHDVVAVPYDMPIPGYRNKTVNTLRLWKAAATDAFDLEEFNSGSYPEAVASKNMAEQISMVLYPNDASENGKELRLKQQYFLVSASLQDIVKDWVEKHGDDFTDFGKKNCFQLNDTHPACAVAELMRILLDQYQMEWQQAWEITTQCMAYTNHTLLPEALERWSVSLFSRLLPRLLDIIYEINHRFLAEVSKKWPGDVARQRRMSLVEEGENPHIRMAHLAIVGSFSVNGVAGLHTELLKSGLFQDFYELWPKKFNNKTNGVTQRRWLAHCNPGLRDLLNETIGEGWQTDLSQIERLRPFAEDAAFRKRWAEVKLQNKRRLIEYVRQTTGIEFQEAALFDVQVKRIHEYKRQLLNLLHVLNLYDRIQRGDTAGMVPRCVLIGGKAAPGYHVAKMIVNLINNVASVINADEKANDLLKLVFLPNYRVSAMEVICPATELSEQISTAGKEASGTGNMKFMMNGALTIGTLDGANIEIREQAGDDNFFLFGLDAAEVAETKKAYDPNKIIAGDEEIQRIMAMIEGGRFDAGNPGTFNILTAGLRNPYDPWLTIADLRDYIDTQRKVDAAYQDQEGWNRMSILNTANSGWFSSDRTIQQYADEIWQAKPLG